MDIAQERPWTLTDLYEPNIYWDGTESFPIPSSAELERALRDYSSKQPRVVVIQSPTAGEFFVGIGGQLAGVRYYPRPGSDRAITAKPRARCRRATAGSSVKASPLDSVRRTS